MVSATYRTFLRLSLQGWSLVSFLLLKSHFAVGMGRACMDANSAGSSSGRGRLRRVLPALAASLLLAALPAAAQTPAATATTLAVTSGGKAVTTVSSGSVVTLTAKVTGAGNVLVTVGQVNFCDAAATFCTDIHLLGTAQLTGAGTATYKFRPGAGSHSYKAVFAGTATYATIYAGSTSSTVALTVTHPERYPSITGIAQSGSAGNYTLTATVGGTGAAAPTGTIQFLDTTNDNAFLGTAVLVPLR